jgi:DNA repair protein RecN (Recombination protein N)
MAYGATNRFVLTHLSVRDLVIVEQLSAQLGSSLTVLTGETGAGKSILVDALSLALGARARTDLVRSGAARAEVTALFDLAGAPAARALLEAQELDEAEQELHLRRTVNADGRSRAYVNGRPVPLQLLRDLGACLVDVHGQHEHQSLLRADTQRQYLDDFGSLGKPATAVASCYARWHELHAENQRLAGEHQSFADRLELLHYQLQELDDVAPADGEYAALLQSFKRLAALEDFRGGCNTALDTLRDSADGGIDRMLSATVVVLQQLHDNELQPIVELLESARIQTDEAAAQLRDLAEQRLPDPERMAIAEARLEVLQGLARKHRVAPDELHAAHQDLRAQCAAAEALHERAASLDGELRKALEAYRAADERLSAARKRTAAKMSTAISAAMQGLGMPGGTSQIRVDPQATDAPRQTGSAGVEMHFSANPGAPLRPLAQAASGGELSRISLAIQVQLALGSGVPTMIFDEVDVGIGGAVAEIVGRQLRDVARSRQVLCITHLPQVASFGKQHLHVRKLSDTKTTSTALEQLDAPSRVEEIARMLGGTSLTARTRAHAKEMLSLAAAVSDQA